MYRPFRHEPPHGASGSGRYHRNRDKSRQIQQHRRLRPSCTPSATTPQPSISLLICPPCAPPPLLTRPSDLLTC